MIVSTNGGKWWRLDYTFEDKRKTLSLGTYPTVTLVDASEEALRLKRMIHQGIDPLEERKEEKQQIKEDTKLNEFEQKTTGKRYQRCKADHSKTRWLLQGCHR